MHRPFQNNEYHCTYLYVYIHNFNIVFVDNIISVNFVEITASAYEGQTVVLTVQREGWIATPLSVPVIVFSFENCRYGEGK